MTIAPFHQRAHCGGPIRPSAVRAALLGGVAVAILTATSGSAQAVLATNTPSAADLPSSASVMFSLVRVLGALALVFTVFFGGLWLFRNWQRLTFHPGKTPKLNVLEVKSLGPRHALYVIGYEQQRLLIASSPAGLNLLSHLPESDGAAVESVPAPRPTFAESLRLALQRKP